MTAAAMARPCAMVVVVWWMWMGQLWRVVAAEKVRWVLETTIVVVLVARSWGQVGL